MWLFVNNHSCFGYIQITTLNNKNTFGAPYYITSFLDTSISTIARSCCFCFDKCLASFRVSLSCIGQERMIFSLDRGNRFHCDVKVIYVPPWYVFPRTHIPSEMCFPYPGTHITRGMCITYERETHITVTSQWYVFPRTGKHISLEIWSYKSVQKGGTLPWGRL